MENKNGQGIFLGVIGVATLVVAIIGATFAYFTASTNTTYNDDIEGSTLTVGGSDLSLTVDKIEFDDATAASNDLVPAVMTESAAGYTTALGANCEAFDHSYTGCHLYKITAHTANTLTGATIAMSAMRTTAVTATNWKYVIYEGVGTTTGSTATSGETTVVNADLKTATPQTFSNTSPYGSFTILNNGTLEQGDTVWYMLVYLLNIEGTQNGDGTNGTTNETGTYSGEVNLTLAGGGQIKASFTSS